MSSGLVLTGNFYFHRIPTEIKRFSHPGGSSSLAKHPDAKISAQDQFHWRGCLRTFLHQVWGGSGTTAKQKHPLHPQSCAEVPKQGLFFMLLQLTAKWLTRGFVIFFKQVDQWLTVFLIITAPNSEILHQNNLAVNLSDLSILLSHKANSFYLNIN